MLLHLLRTIKIAVIPALEIDAFHERKKNAIYAHYFIIFFNNKTDQYWLYNQYGNMEIYYAAEVLWKNPSFPLRENQGGDGCLSITTTGANNDDSVSKTKILKAKLSVSIQYSFLTYVKIKLKKKNKLQYESLLSLWKDINEE